VRLPLESSSGELEKKILYELFVVSILFHLCPSLLVFTTRSERATAKYGLLREEVLGGTRRSGYFSRIFVVQRRVVICVGALVSNLDASSMGVRIHVQLMAYNSSTYLP